MCEESQEIHENNPARIYSQINQHLNKILWCLIKNALPKSLEIRELQNLFIK